jgi:hypothetical protein
MWSDEDKEIAVTAAQALGRLQNKTDAATLKELRDIHERLRNTRTDEHKRTVAWEAIGVLIDRIEKTPRDPAIQGLWHRAIQAANAWRGSMTR